MLRTLLAILLVSGIAVAEDFKGIADVNFYLNERPTDKIETVKIAPGGEVSIEVRATLKKDSNVTIWVSASGFSESEPQPFVTIVGPSQFGKIGDPIAKKSGDTIDLTWRLKPSSVWSGGSVPLNIGLGFRDPTTLQGETLKRTIANIYIEPAGAAPAPAAATPRQPGFEVTLSVVVLLGLAVLAAGRRRFSF